MEIIIDGGAHYSAAEVEYVNLKQWHVIIQPDGENSGTNTLEPYIYQHDG
jgi:hypothetical protein